MKKKLKQLVREERSAYECLSTPVKRLYAWLCHDRDFYTFKFIKLLRYTEYYYRDKDNNILSRILYMFYKNRKNRLGQRIGLDIGENTCGKGLYIAHNDIIIGSAKIGENCKFHGQNCVGSGVTIGDNCEIWVGAKLFKSIQLADNIVVAAGAIVVSSFLEEGIVIGGVPARKIKNI